VADEAVHANGDTRTDERVGLDSGVFSDGYIALDFTKWPDEHPFIEIAPVQVDRFDYPNALSYSTIVDSSHPTPLRQTMT
jgi:hypothetical protein